MKIAAMDLQIHRGYFHFLVLSFNEQIFIYF